MQMPRHISAKIIISLVARVRSFTPEDSPFHFAQGRFSWLSLRKHLSQRTIAVLAITPAEENGDHPKRNGRKDAGFRADAASGKPRRAIKRGIEQVVISGNTAVMHAVEKRLAPIPSGVESNCPPQISRAA